MKIFLGNKNGDSADDKHPVKSTSSGLITSPNFPNLYVKDFNYEWYIQGTTEKSRIQLYFNSLDLEGSKMSKFLSENEIRIVDWIFPCIYFCMLFMFALYTYCSVEALISFQTNRYPLLFLYYSDILNVYIRRGVLDKALDYLPE